MRRASAKNHQALEALRAAVAEALERKRRLGQYAVIWRDGRVVRLEPDEQASPQEPRRRAKRA
jgi:hypothetical protein